MKIYHFFRDLFHEKLHISWLITAACLGFIFGAAFSILPSDAGFSRNLFLILPLALIGLAFVSRLRVMILFAVIGGLTLGMWRGLLDRVDLNKYETWIGQEVVVKGALESDPDLETGGIMKIRLKNAEVILASDRETLESEAENVKEYFQALPGLIWVSAMAPADPIKRSDVVEIEGKLKPGFGSFPASMTYAKVRSAVRSPDADPMRDLRDGFGQALGRVITKPAVDLGMGILAGQKTALPADLSSAFIIASLTHIVVASGYNLTILIRAARRLFARISRFAALSFGGGLAFAFASITGFSPSMTRASIVAGLSLVAWYYGRRWHPIALLSFVAALTIAVDPSNVWGNVGWYLSFFSFIGVIIFAPLVKDYFFGDQKKPEGRLASLRQIFIETLSAQVMAAPLIMLFMGQFSIYGLLANLLVLPILPLTMLFTFIAGIGALVLPQFIAQIVAWPANFLLDWVIGVANWTAELPNASQQIQLSLWATGFVFVVIFGLILYLKRKTGHNFREGSVVE